MPFFNRGRGYAPNRAPLLFAAVVVYLFAALLVIALAQTVRAHQTLTITTAAAQGFTLTDGALTCNGTCPAGTANAITAATITVEGTSIRWWDDGTAPTTAAGHLAPDGTSFVVNGHTNIVNFQAIPTTGTATVRGSFSRP